MGAKWQKITLTIPKAYKPDEREAIAQEIVEFIRERVQKKRTDKNGDALPPYSESYVKSLDFKIAGKSKGKVNLTLSGDMLGALDVLGTKPGKLTIGFERGSAENARADGNIRGTYGQSRSIGPKRDFLGIRKEELETILEKYPLEDRSTSRDRAATSRAADRVTGRNRVETEDEGEDG